MSDTSQGPGWWQASDDKWYPPEQRPGEPAASSETAAPPASEGAREAKATAKGDKARAKAMRPWFKKKRFILGGILALLVIAVIATAGGDSNNAGETLTQDAESDADATDSASETTSPGDDDSQQGSEEQDAEEQDAEQQDAEESEPVAVGGFTTYEALGETWASAGIVLTGLSGGSQELTISLLDEAGTPLSTTTEYVGSDRDGGEVLVSANFTDDVPTAASVRVDVSDASSFTDADPFPVEVSGQEFDGNFWTVNGTATNDRSGNIELGLITCVAFRGGEPVAGAFTYTDTIVPDAQVAWNVTDTFNPEAEEVRCQGEAS